MKSVMVDIFSKFSENGIIKKNYIAFFHGLREFLNTLYKDLLAGANKHLLCLLPVSVT